MSDSASFQLNQPIRLARSRIHSSPPTSAGHVKKSDSTTPLTPVWSTNSCPPSSAVGVAVGGRFNLDPKRRLHRQSDHDRQVGVPHKEFVKVGLFLTTCPSAAASRLRQRSRLSAIVGSSRLAW